MEDTTLKPFEGNLELNLNEFWLLDGCWNLKLS